MVWKGVTVSEQRQNFIEDYSLNYYSVRDLADRYSISRKTAHKWINRFEQSGQNGYHELSRRPLSCPWQTEQDIIDLIVQLRSKHPSWGSKKLIHVLKKRHSQLELPSTSTTTRILQKENLIKRHTHHKRAHPGCPQSVAKEPNEIWGADYKGQFRLGNTQYCFPQTVSDLFTRFLLGCDSHPEISQDLTKQHFLILFDTFGLPRCIRTDNGVPFASCALARLSVLSVWWIKLGIYPELIEPGVPQQNGIHERIHRTMKRDATMPPGANLAAQQRKFDHFRKEYNEQRPHEAIGMRTPSDIYHPSSRKMPSRIETYDYPSHFLVRLISRCGTMRVISQQVFVSTTLKEEYVGLEEIDDGVYDIFFCFYHIGRYDVRTNRIQDIISRVPTRYGQIDLAKRV